MRKAVEYNGYMTLEDLNDAIQAVMGGANLWQFSYKKFKPCCGDFSRKVPSNPHG